MLPEIGASELLLIAVVALIVVGPKDLPALLRKVGQAMAKVRGMAAEFRSSFDEMARQSELDELRREVEAMRRGQVIDLGQGEAADTMREIKKSLDANDWADADQASYAPPPEPDPAPEPASPESAPPESAPLRPARKRAVKSRTEGEAAPPRKPRARKAAAPEGEA